MGEGTTRRGTDTPVHHPERPAGLLIKEDQKAADCPPHPAACLALVTFFLRAVHSRGLKGTITAMIKGGVGARRLRAGPPGNSLAFDLFLT